MYYIIAECAANAETSVEALNTVRLSRGIPYSDEIHTLGYDDKDATSEENKQQTRRINEIMKEYRKEYYAEASVVLLPESSSLYYLLWLWCSQYDK